MANIAAAAAAVAPSVVLVRYECLMSAARKMTTATVAKITIVSLPLRFSGSA